MKIFFTAEYNEEELKPLYEMGDVVLDGWALGLPKMEEDELVKKTKDADIIITSYDDITRRVIEGAPNLKLIACTRATPVNKVINEGNISYKNIYKRENNEYSMVR